MGLLLILVAVATTLLLLSIVGARPLVAAAWVAGVVLVLVLMGYAHPRVLLVLG